MTIDIEHHIVTPTLRISAHAIEATIAPACGGLTVSATHHGLPLLYTPEAPELKPGAVHFFGNWPLVPFANRAFGAILRVGEEQFELPANDTSRPNTTIHGFSWPVAWEIIAHGPDAVHLRHRQSEPAGPYLYTADQTISATTEGLITTLSVTNDAGRALPFGLGLHPWFPRDADTELSVSARKILDLGEDYKPMRVSAPGPGSDYSKPRRLNMAGETVAQFCGADGPAHIRYPSRGYQLIMSWENAPCPLLWSPPGAPFLCLEPQTHALGAPNDPIAMQAGPLKMLSPGESLKMSLSLKTGRL